jgi:hypothetical protein
MRPVRIKERFAANSRPVDAARAHQRAIRDSAAQRR